MCVGEREESTVDVTQVSAPSHCAFAAVIDVITGDIRKEPYWTMMFAKRDVLSRMRSER